MKLKVPEKDIQRSILDYLLMRGHFVWKSGTGAFRMNYNGRERFVRMGTKGCSDIIGVEKRTGRFIAVEVKVPGGELTPDQLEFLQNVNSRNGIGLMATSIDDVIAVGL